MSLQLLKVPKNNKKKFFCTSSLYIYICKISIWSWFLSIKRWLLCDFFFVCLIVLWCMFTCTFMLINDHVIGYEYKLNQKKLNIDICFCEDMKQTHMKKYLTPWKFWSNLNLSAEIVDHKAWEMSSQVWIKRIVVYSSINGLLKLSN